LTALGKFGAEEIQLGRPNQTEEEKMNRPMFGTTMKVFAALLFTFAICILAGCGGSKATNDSAVTTATVDEDVALSVAGSIASDDGGAVDEVSAITTLAGGLSLSSPAPGNENATALKPPVPTPHGGSAIYDPNTGIWSIDFDRTFGNSGGAYYAAVTRTYTYKFMNKDGQAQKFWKVGNDTAYTIEFTIVSGTGYYRTPHMMHHLTSLSGNLIATGVNTEMITVNGTYTRSAIDTLETHSATRSSNHTLQLTLTNVMGPRGLHVDMAQQVSGTISGTFNAAINFTTGNGYSDKNVNRTFTIDLADGQADIIIGGQHFITVTSSGELMSSGQ
jgi:hypothetical protein